MKIDDGVDVGGDIDINQAEEIDFSVGEDLDDGVNLSCDISCGGRSG